MRVKILTKDGNSITETWVDTVALIDDQLWCYHVCDNSYSAMWEIKDIKSFFIEPEDEEQ